MGADNDDVDGGDGGATLEVESTVAAENKAETAGTLALTDGAAHASIEFLGDYTTANFSPATDGKGGTLFTYHS